MILAQRLADYWDEPNDVPRIISCLRLSHVKPYHVANLHVKAIKGSNVAYLV